MTYRIGGIVCLLVALGLTPFAWSTVAASSSGFVAIGAIIPAALAWIGAIVLLSHKNN